MSYESENKNVSHPAHYQGADGMETIDVIRNFTGPHYVGYLHGNAIKYVLRYEKKNGIEDLEKAIWYLTELLEYKRKEQDIEKRKENAEKLGFNTDSPVSNTNYINAINKIMKDIDSASKTLSEGFLGKV